MRYTAAELLAVARTPVGRAQLARHGRVRLLWLVRPAARLYRETLVRGTRLVAVTGSFGKTSTAAAVREVLGLPPYRNYAENGLYGIPAALLRVRPGARHAVIEVGIDRPGQMDGHSRLLQPDVVVITAVGADHSDRLGTLKVTQREKARLMIGLRPLGLAILNGDDPRVRAMAAWTDAQVMTYGLEAGNDVRAEEIRLDWPRGTRFRLRVRGEAREAYLPLLGRTMVATALAAAAVGAAEGLALDAIVGAFERLRPTPGRMQVVPLPGGATMLRDDTKGSIESIHAALDTLEEVPGRRFLVVTRPPPWPVDLEPLYRDLGRRVAATCAHLVLVGGGNDGLAEAALEAGLPAEAMHQVGAGTREAIALLRRLVQPGDTVLLKGRIFQRLERIPLALQGEKVVCDLENCEVETMHCVTCPMRLFDWGERRVLR